MTYDHRMDEPGSLELPLDPSFGTQRGGDGFTAAWLELEHGVRGWWTTELYLDAQSTRQECALLSGVRWEDRCRSRLKELAANSVLYVELEDIDAADTTLRNVIGHDVEADRATANAPARLEGERELETALILPSWVGSWNLAESLIAARNPARELWESGYAGGASRPLADVATGGSSSRTSSRSRGARARIRAVFGEVAAMRVPETMQAMVFERPGQALSRRALPVPRPGRGELLLAVRACGVCRTDLHLVDGDLPEPSVPVVPGHEIVASVAALGEGAAAFAIGDRVGVPWLAWTCGECRYCRSGRENLCERALFTGYTRDGGYAEFTLADQRACYRLPAGLDDAHAAPLLCAGAIGYRSYRMAGEGVERLGIYGFGAAAHILAQLAVAKGQRVYAFTRAGDAAAQAFARSLGAVWAGDSTASPPEPLDAAIIFAPVGGLVPAALRAVDKGGVVVCGGIHMSDVPAFPYSILWEERVLRSVANLTRADGEELLALAPRVGVKTEVELFPLDAANDALDALRHGRLRGAAVLQIG